MEKQKVIVYIDGFNFYYGLKKNYKWRRFYWLDVVKFFEMFIKPDQELLCVKYLHKTIKCFNCGYLIKTYEEKESDVRIATQIVNDANNHICDVAIVVSADSDMIPAIELAKDAGILPDTVHLSQSNFDLRIPSKWKEYQET